MSDYDEEEIPDLDPVRWSWMTPAILGAVTLAQISEAITDGITNLATAMAAHSNWRRQRKSFEEEARAAIERITAE